MSGIEAATLETKDGKIVVVAVRPDVLRNEQRSQGVLDTLSTLFPDSRVVLAATTPAGPEFFAKAIETTEPVRRKGFSGLSWRRYSFAA